MAVELFEPDGRGIKLTAAGEAFAERAVRLRPRSLQSRIVPARLGTR
ncbi:hypothetical protein AB0H83_29285 [Dactylosporangium sp. NPDC050688]